MAKAIVLCIEDVDPGADDSNVILRIKVAFVGATVPNSPVIDLGPQGNGLAVPINIATITAALYSNAVETACVARATVLGFSILNTDVLMPTYSRGT